MYTVYHQQYTTKGYGVVSLIQWTKNIKKQSTGTERYLEYTRESLKKRASAKSSTIALVTKTRRKKLQYQKAAEYCRKTKQKQ